VKPGATTGLAPNAFPLLRDFIQEDKAKITHFCLEFVWKIENLPKTPIKGGARYRVRTCDPYRVKVLHIIVIIGFC
jgi:hypothetical protein